jgi:hypothetical protein
MDEGFLTIIDHAFFSRIGSGPAQFIVDVRSNAVPRLIPAAIGSLTSHWPATKPAARPF